MTSACHVCAAVLVHVARSRRSEPLLDERSLEGFYQDSSGLLIICSVNFQKVSEEALKMDMSQSGLDN